VYFLFLSSYHLPPPTRIIHLIYTSPSFRGDSETAHVISIRFNDFRYDTRLVISSYVCRVVGTFKAREHKNKKKSTYLLSSGRLTSTYFTLKEGRFALHRSTQKNTPRSIILSSVVVTYKTTYENIIYKPTFYVFNFFSPTIR